MVIIKSLINSRLTETLEDVVKFLTNLYLTTTIFTHGLLFPLLVIFFFDN